MMAKLSHHKIYKSNYTFKTSSEARGCRILLILVCLLNVTSVLTLALSSTHLWSEKNLPATLWGLVMLAVMWIFWQTPFSLDCDLNLSQKYHESDFVDRLLWTLKIGVGPAIAVAIGFLGSNWILGAVVGAVCGAVFLGVFSDGISRKGSILIASVASILGGAGGAALSAFKSGHARGELYLAIRDIYITADGNQTGDMCAIVTACAIIGCCWGALSSDNFNELIVGLIGGFFDSLVVYLPTRFLYDEKGLPYAISFWLIWSISLGLLFWSGRNQEHLARNSKCGLLDEQQFPDVRLVFRLLPYVHRFVAQRHLAGVMTLLLLSLLAVEAFLTRTPGERRADDPAAQIVQELTQQMNLLNMAGRYPDAMQIAQRLVTMRQGEKEKYPAEYAASLRNLAVFQAEMGNYAKAKPLLLQTIAIRKNVLGEKHPDYAHSLDDLAFVYAKEGDYTKAERLLRQAVAILKEVPDERNPEYATSLNKWEAYKAHLGEYAASLSRLGMVCDRMGKNAEAESVLRQSIAILKKTLGDTDPEYAASLLRLAIFYTRTSDYAAAGPLYREALSIQKRALGVNHPAYATSLSELGIMCGCCKKPDWAFSNMIQGLRSVEAFFNDMALSLSEQQLEAYSDEVEHRYDAFYSLLGRYISDHAEWTTRALAINLGYKGGRSDAMAARNRVVLTSGNPNLATDVEALRATIQAIVNASMRGPGKEGPEKHRRQIAKLEAKRDEQEASLARRSSKFAEAKKSRKATIEEVTKQLPPESVYLDFVQYHKFDYDAANWTNEQRYLAFVLTRGDDNKPVVRIVDLGPAETIDSLVSRFRAVLQGGDDSKRGVSRVIEEAKAAGTEKAVVPREVREIGAQLYEKVLKPFEPEMVGGAPEEQKKILGQDAQAAGGSGRRVLVLAPAGNLNLLPFEVLSIPGKSGYLADHYQIAYCLGRDLVREARRRELAAQRGESVEDGSEIVASPDFERAAEDQVAPMEVASASTADAVSAGAIGGQVRLSTRSALKNWPVKVSPLPGTLAEGRKIIERSKARGQNALMKSGAEASEKAIKAIRKPALLHLATHGFFLEDVERAAPEDRARSIGIGLSDGFPGGVSGFAGVGGFGMGGPRRPGGPPQLHNPLLRSGLCLAGFNRLANGVEVADSNNDGILTAMEVTGMDLYGTRLVVLSACETGLGEVQRGEGVAGLQRAFRIAGARNVVMSLWSVPDEETMWLMDAFYESYLGGATPRAALEKARGTVRKRLIERDGIDHPYFWAAFILNGPEM